MADTMPRLRRRVALVFAAVAVGSSAAVLAGLVLAARGIAEPGAVRYLAQAGGISLAAILGLTVWAWLRFDERWVRPLGALARTMQTLAHSGTSGAPEPGLAAGLGPLGPASEEIAGALTRARADLATARAWAAAEAEAQKARLEAVLRDLDEAVLISTRSHRIVLCNHRAVDLLGAAGEVGLGRTLGPLLSLAPLDDALERLDRARERGGAGGTTTAVSATPDGERTFRCRVGLMPGDERGYVLTFRDITAEVAADVERDRLIEELLTAGLRAASGIPMALDILRGDPGLGPDDRRALESAASAEAEWLGEQVRALGAEAGRLTAASWPMDDVPSADLFGAVARLLGDAPGRPSPAVEGEEMRLHCDSLSIAALLAHLVRTVGGEPSLRAAKTDGRCFVEILWHGPPALLRDVADWLGVPLAETPARLTGREVLAQHQSDLWPDRAPDGRARLRLPLAAAAAGVATGPTARPEFYDFGVEDRPPAEDLADRPLATLPYVAFDTETTGLEPSRGDEVVQIAGVRIVNGRVLTGEVFDTLVDPARRIPASSTAIHGITEAMVDGAPSVATALLRFHAFAGDAVLIAHNAPFDMAFLTRGTGASLFDNQVLDTVLLSAFLHDHTGQHTLDALAARFDVAIDPALRHTALGDALATARVFVRLLPLLRARGVTTLGRALEVSGTMRAIRRQQAKYA